MKIKCKVCRKETEIDELEYTPGDKIIVECQRCGNELEAVIPLREEEPSEKPRVKVVERDLKSTWNAAESASISETAISDNAKSKQETTPTPPPTSGAASINSPEATPIPQRQCQSAKTNHNGNIPPQPTTIYPTNNSPSNGKTILFIVIGVCILAGIAIWMLTGKSSSNADVYTVAQDTAYAVAEEAFEPVAVAEVVDETNYDSEIFYGEDENGTDEVIENTDIQRAFIPIIGSCTSAEAYDVYAPYLTDDKFGDAWATTDLIQNAIRNEEVEYFVKGEGDIEGYPLSIDAVWLKNGRLYGRYLNDSNGVKLDINGGFDESNNLVIKLGHKSETSYWVLKYEGPNDDGTHQFKGTWGRKNKPTNLRIRLSDRQ